MTDDFLRFVRYCNAAKRRADDGDAASALVAVALAAATRHPGWAAGWLSNVQQGMDAMQGEGTYEKALITTADLFVHRLPLTEVDECLTNTHGPKPNASTHRLGGSSGARAASPPSSTAALPLSLWLGTNTQCAARHARKKSWGKALPDYLTTNDVARILGLHPGYVRLLRRQRNVGTLYGNSWLYTRADLEALETRAKWPARRSEVQRAKPMH